MTKKKADSRRKGADGERELANFLKDRGIEARRGQQFSGGTDSPDVVTAMAGLHLEVKRTEKFNAYAAMAQADNDAASDDIPVVVHRRNRQRWLAVVDFEDFLNILKDAYGYGKD